MPCICQFFGIAVYIYYNDHSPPHFHAKYSGDEALYEIDSLRIYRGGLPRRAHTLVIEWADLHRAELIDDWHRAGVGSDLRPIEPLE